MLSECVLNTYKGYLKRSPSPELYSQIDSNYKELSMKTLFNALQTFSSYTFSFGSQVTKNAIDRNLAILSLRQILDQKNKQPKKTTQEKLSVTISDLRVTPKQGGLSDLTIEYYTDNYHHIKQIQATIEDGVIHKNWREIDCEEMNQHISDIKSF